MINAIFIYFSRILDRWGGGGHHIQFHPFPYPPSGVCETEPAEHKSAKHVSIMN
jgi:hypothetical protein